jgi:predicted acyl esterase
MILVTAGPISAPKAVAEDLVPAATSIGVTPPVYEVTVERAWLPMRDGVRLSVTFSKPTPRTPGETFPVLLDLLPYRKDELPERHPSYFAYFPRRGYIMATVDIRGTGSSEGAVPPREYSELELDDAMEIIDQLSRLPGSNGRVGMWGKSWGGFNAIQVAMREPPALKAILAVEATDDLFHDDVHNMDGAFHVDQFDQWMDHLLILPKTPNYELDEDYFENRFESYPWFLTYAKQQRDGEFWRRNSLRWQYDKLKIPAYLIGGLLDGYRDSVPRMLENVKAPVRAAMGPYEHHWPDNGVPGPNYEWRHEAVRWWDHWLKDRDTGIMEDAPLAVFVREGHGPDLHLKTTPGHWISDEWPIPGTTWRKFYPSMSRQLRDQLENGEKGVESLRYVPSYGVATGLWWGEPTGDIRPDDAGSLVYDSPVLEEGFEIVGFPRVRLRVSADAPLAHWVARLEDVQPDGTVSLVTGRLLNGSQRDSRLEPELLVPGEIYDLEIDLHFTTWTFKPGHRVRLAVSNSLFAMIWPTPHPMTTQLHLGVESTRMELPVIPPAERVVPEFLPPEPREELAEVRYLEGVPWRYEYKRDVSRAITSFEWTSQTAFVNHGRRYHTDERNYYETNDNRPADSRFAGEAKTTIDLEDRKLEFRSTFDVRSDEKNFHVKIIRYVFKDDDLLRQREWNETIPREFN